MKNSSSKEIYNQYTQAYIDSEKIEKIFTEKLQTTPIEQAPYYWIKFARTLRTALDLFEQRAADEINLHPSKLDTINKRIS